MASFKDWLTGLDNKSVPADTDELYLRDDTADVSKKITIGELKAAIGEPPAACNVALAIQFGAF